MIMASAIRDAAPDAWGRRVILNRTFGTYGTALDALELDELDFLLESGSDRIGALDFQASATAYVARGAVTRTSRSCSPRPRRSRRTCRYPPNSTRRSIMQLDWRRPVESPNRRWPGQICREVCERHPHLFGGERRIYRHAPGCTRGPVGGAGPARRGVRQERALGRAVRSHRARRNLGAASDGFGADHARNHAAFWDGTQLSLTPAYDICPQARR